MLKLGLFITPTPGKEIAARGGLYGDNKGFFSQ